MRSWSGVLIIVCCLLCLSLSGCVDDVDPRDELCFCIGGALLHGITDNQIQEISTAVDSWLAGNTQAAERQLAEVLTVLPEEELASLQIPSETEFSSFYTGVYCNDVRDLRTVLAHVSTIKQIGFDTIWIEVQMMAHSDGTLYIPGKEVYLFYLNAFHASGFRTWISLGHCTYEFPYRWDKTPSEHFPFLESQREVFFNIEPLVLEWACCAEAFGVDTFIPEEESNTLVLEYGANRTNLNHSDREFLSTWHQQMLSQIQLIFSGHTGFATNDGGPLEQFEDREQYPFPIGPDFDYTGYDYLVTKIPFRNSFESEEQWLFELDNRLSSCQQYALRDGAKGIIWYEAGMPVGESYDPQELNHWILDEDAQEKAVDQSLNYSAEYDLAGIFFKPSPKQIHEGNWWFVDTAAGESLREAFATTGVIADRPIDYLWTTLGEEGLLVCQLACADDVPFDPQYSIDQYYGTGRYQDIELLVDGSNNYFE